MRKKHIISIITIVILSTMMFGCGKKSKAVIPEDAEAVSESDADDSSQDNTDDSDSELEENDTELENIPDAEDTFLFEDLTGAWELNEFSFAGDPCIYQLAFGKDGQASFIQYQIDSDKWEINTCYDGIAYENEPNESADDDLLYINLDLSALDENGTEIDRISGDFSVKYSNEYKETITITLIDGTSLMADHFYEPVVFKRAEKEVEDGDIASGHIEPGVYYDRYLYESDFIDSGFVGIALNEKGQAFITIQDCGWGTWTKSGELNLTNNIVSKHIMLTGGDSIYIDDCYVYEKAPDEVVPDEINAFMETGEIPLWLRDAGWQNAYWSLIYDVSNGYYNESYPYYDINPTDREYAQTLSWLRAEEYYLYDIDKDDMPELIVKYGTCEADYWGNIYKCNEDGEVEYVGGISLGHSVLYSYPKKNGMIVQYAHMGSSSINLLSMNENGGFEFEELYEERMGMEVFKDYTPVYEIVKGAKEIMYSEINSTEIIDEYRNIIK